ncbi:methionyl-tRNA formyltransferase [Salinibacterium sp. NSLL150]|uniref:methionyl-tRNA formyltransferase n=1 Tax=unclassified Salinibacterium TaxID=2632331 RepID=UPI0018CCAA61|nr:MULTISPECIES: methionyl-tRNA formyltransferase [unclassified Salinibacterium]MBH0099079.1 methionyl-tRNA formyltransferase [Salinibacterium sp. NSLL35]MBH0101833.1 methionyl-tRNA formyltransferase [Salinibacterium sp. NSLL150]MBH0104593.1 methionyl-tRNA formyltransferase [Salinibacterium sp. NSLL16]MBH0107353.1 methionyl-tRNA formyltransferase [Salinibacterium sp. NSLL17]
MRLLFAGSPEVAVPSLDALLNSEHEVAGVLTRTDSPQGRRRVMTSTPVAARAEEAGISVIRANRLDAAAASAITDLTVDLGVIVAYGGLVPASVLTIPRLGWINLHFSLLPQWRGAAPVQRAIMAGDTVSGAAVFQLVEQLDAGDVFATMTEPIGAQQTAGSLLQQLSFSGAELLSRVVDSIGAGTATAVPQTGDVTLAPKLSLEDGRIDWTESAQTVHNRIRGVTPEPGASTTIDGARLKVLEAAIARDVPTLAPGHFDFVGKKVLVGTATEPLELLRVHPEGRKAMDAAAWWRGLNSESEVVAS